MNDNNNNYNTPETTNEPNSNFDGILNNAPPPPVVPVPKIKPRDKVKDIPRRKRSRELER